ncbi:MULTISPECIES: hypothetical protein [Olivibacter]|uniref:Uncharacterized protein n=1 Tax=Olivibacter oleidegradans TaxID=760123 RepID=A0ABV6HJA9_9SPHI|nr:hypothetical protein [Olivibacter jilunii]
MKKITLTLYTFGELEPMVQEKVIEDNRYINTGDNFWWQDSVEYFVLLSNTIGVQAEPDKIWFSGFYSQGDGTAFEAAIDIMALVDGVRSERWKETFPCLELPFEAPEMDRRVLDLLRNGRVDFRAGTKATRNSNAISLRSIYSLSSDMHREHVNISKELEKLEAWIDHAVHVLNGHFFKVLTSNFETEIRDEAVKDTLIEHGYLFTADGRMAEFLTKLSEMETIEITDMGGNRIAVDDLEASIKQAALFMGYAHKEKGWEEMDRERATYWKDIHEKLMKLKEEGNG